ncbi:MAG: asparagine synthase B [Elusimicrobia bacterium RIFCSPLOWO2_02_FULL_61_11]|nr:MAG: asparagine synthase B [Elusimicrobia bacterium RIFCSPLOWO2_02_FULL_61_11]
MCGILAILDIKGNSDALRKKALTLAKRLRHRGPDWSGIYSDANGILLHERLSIVDVEHGAQPLIDRLTGRVLSVNGEIYNHEELRKELKRQHDYQTASDCEPILYLYDEFGPEFVKRMNGIFAFVLYDPATRDYFISRDPIGVVPLYWGWDKEGNLFVSSELKAIADVCSKLDEFPPGHYYSSKDKKLVKYYNPAWADTKTLPSNPLDLKALREAFESAVKRQLMCDVPYGVLLSGGLDSSLVSAIASRFKEKRVEDHDASPAWWPRLHSFSVGLHGSPDLKMAKIVADFIGSVHHEIHFTEQEGIDAVPDVIYQLETFDITTIRAATPMYLMARKIKAMGIKMVLSGEGADEVFGGYLYFHKAPDAREFHEETVRKLAMLHKYDCLRANKSTAAWGLEARVPFLDKEFLETAMNIDPAEKMCVPGERMEKWMLRKAFEGYLPDEVLWRQKEQFSDGVGYGWIDSLKKRAEEEVSDKQMENAAFRFPLKTPLTKEGYLYRSIFEGHFPNPEAPKLVPDGPSIACSTPTAIRWDASWAKLADPSGRAVKSVHKDSL